MICSVAQSLKMKYNLWFTKRKQTNKNEGGNWLQILAILAGSLGSLTSSALWCWPSPTIPIIISANYPTIITMEQASFLTVIPSITVICTIFMSSALMNKIGRKYMLLMVAPPQILTWIIVSSTESLYWFYFSRVVDGIADSILFAVVPTYMGEIATPKIRGSWGTLPMFCVYVGQFLMNAIGGYCDIKTTAYAFMPIPIIFFILFAFMPESPYFLLMKNKNEEAKLALQRLRRKFDVDLELKQLRADVDRQLSESGNYRDIFVNKVNRRSFFIAVLVRSTQILCGMAAFSVYTVYLFNEAGGSISSITSVMIFSCLLVIMSIVPAFTLDILGRKHSIVLSSTGCTAILISESIYFYIKDNTEINVSIINWFPIIGMLLYIIFFSIGIGVVPFVIMTEVFSTSIKGKAITLITIFFNVNIAIVTKLFQVLTSNFGLYAPFLFYGVSTAVLSVLSCLYVPETQGKTLEEIQQSFMKNKKQTCAGKITN